ncbi:MAG: peptide deformylase [Bacteroidales bacterium]|nr:peptide deformylase [Bacteroidales bacterium]MBQ2005945.1 peptide deformylase [Bacteroidales bacterium]
MIRPIFLYGSEVLRKKASPVDLNQTEEIKTLVADLWETLASSEGCGLAAPQIGESLRVVVVDGDVMSDVYDYLKGFKRTMINPEIVSESNIMCEYNEGCLSVPGIYADVRRPDSLRVEYYDENLEKQSEVFERFAARMVQHELSHLDGVLFTDLVAPIRRKMVARKLQGISAGKIRTSYKSKIK